MKTSKWIHTAIMTLTLAMAGCNKQNSVDTSAFERTFKSAEATTQTTAEKAVTAIKSADYSGALTELKTLASNAKLTPEQQQAVQDMMAQVQKAIAAVAGKASSGASNAMNEMQKAMPK